MVEVIGVMWVYGVKRFLGDIKFMLGLKSNFYFKVCWSFITPISVLVIFIYSRVVAQPLTAGSYQYSSGIIGES